HARTALSAHAPIVAALDTQDIRILHCLTAFGTLPRSSRRLTDDLRFEGGRERSLDAFRNDFGEGGNGRQRTAGRTTRCQTGVGVVGSQCLAAGRTGEVNAHRGATLSNSRSAGHYTGCTSRRPTLSASPAVAFLDTSYVFGANGSRLRRAGERFRTETEAL